MFYYFNAEILNNFLYVEKYTVYIEKIVFDCNLLFS